MFSTSRSSRLLIVSVGLAVFILASPATVIADFGLDWYTIDGGGGMRSTAGDFELSGTIGQPDAGDVMTGGTFELTGGFWAGVSAFCFGDLNYDGQIDLSDLAALLAHYDEPGTWSYEDGDLDGDGDVDLADLAALLSVYDTTCP